MMRIACVLLALAAAVVSGCNRERRDLRAAPAERATLPPNDRTSSLVPGASLPPAPVSGPAGRIPTSNPLNGNAFAIAEGQRLYEWFNCSGCHAHGGGGIGPALMDKEWVYGSSPAKIYESIAKGREHGMPAWGTKIPEYQIWQLVAYVRSMSGEQPRSATPARADSIQSKTGDILRRKQAP